MFDLGTTLGTCLVWNGKGPSRHLKKIRKSIPNSYLKGVGKFTKMSYIEEVTCMH